jgi:hypothetical protein
MTLATFCVTFAFSETFVISSALFIAPPFYYLFPLLSHRGEGWGEGLK